MTSHSENEFILNTISMIVKPEITSKALIIFIMFIYEATLRGARRFYQ